MKRLLLGFLFISAGFGATATPDNLQLPAFPLPALVLDGGKPKEISSMRLLRELFRGGVHGTDHFETTDSDYCLLQSDDVGILAAWLEGACRGLGFDLLQMRTHAYDGATFSRLLEVSTSLAALQKKGDFRLAMPIGLMVCKRDTAWGDLRSDGAADAYVLLATEAGILVYDPPTRQLVNLADFPNKAGIIRIHF